MAGSPSTVHAKRLTRAGLIAMTAATLLMMAWAVFPSAAGATHGTVTPPLGTQEDPWTDNVPICHSTGSVSNPFVANHPSINANNDNPPLSGHNNHLTDIVPPFWYFETNNVPTFFPGLNWPSGEAIWANNCEEVTTTTTTTPPTTTTTEPPTTTTEPPTTTTTSVSPTTVTTPPKSPPDETTTTPVVQPTTVRPPDKTAFTGIENVVPIGALALALMTIGSGLLWAGSRLKRKGI